MNKIKRLQENNAGLSLVELIVSIAIFSIVSIAFFEFLMVAIKHYQKETMEVEVQYEAQLVVNQLQDLLIDAKKGVTYEEITAVGDPDDESGEAPDITGKRLTIYNTDRYYVIDWNAGQRKLFYSEYRLNDAGGFDLVAPGNALMAEYVREFSVDLSYFDRSNSVELDLVFDNEREYQVTQNVKLRNQVSVNVPRDELYGD